MVCRVYPLERRWIDGRATYNMADTHRCLAACPEILAQPRRRVGEWLQEQRVTAGEQAHDAYGRLVCGLLAQARQLAGADFAEAVHARAALSPSARAALLPRPWFELTTAPALDELVDDPAIFIQAHAERILGVIGAGFAGEPPRAAVLLATIALQLGVPLGISPAAATAHALSTPVVGAVA